jgi:hypothetical protein
MPLAPGLRSPELNNIKGNRTQTGNRVLISLAGIDVGLAQTLRPSDDYGVEPAGSLGYLEARELVPLNARHSLNLGMVQLSKESLYYAAQASGSPSIIPQSGETDDPSQASALDGYEFDIEVYDRFTGKGLVKYYGCVYSSGDTDFSLNRITITNAVFIARHREGQMVVKS